MTGRKKPGLPLDAARWQSMVGQRFGRLVVQSIDIPAGGPAHRITCECRCDCGETHRTSARLLRYGEARSCGCLQRDRAKAGATHGHNRPGKRTKEYAAWAAMIQRCTLPSQKGYAWYGGRGIKVCDAWLASFDAFLRDVGMAPSQQHSLDRIDSNGHYEPGNVRWATPEVQAANKRSSRWVTIGGETLHLNAWARRSGVNAKTLQYRLEKGWPEARLLAPADQRYRHPRHPRRLADELEHGVLA